MNTGMMDAHNLGWKLALMAAGHAPGELLDTYGEERGPVARNVLNLTHSLVRVGTLQDGFKCAIRDSVMPLATRSKTIQRRAARRLSQVGVDYRSSSLAKGGGGARMADRWVSAGGLRMRLYQVLRRRRQVLLLPAGARADGLGQFRSLLAIVEADLEKAVLVRPDGYVAAVARADVLDSLLPYLRSVHGDSRGHAPSPQLAGRSPATNA